VERRKKNSLAMGKLNFQQKLKNTGDNRCFKGGNTRKEKASEIGVVFEARKGLQLPKRETF
jgi:hypothetical protein